MAHRGRDVRYKKRKRRDSLNDYPEKRRRTPKRATYYDYEKERPNRKTSNSIKSRQPKDSRRRSRQDVDFKRKTKNYKNEMPAKNRLTNNVLVKVLLNLCFYIVTIGVIAGTALFTVSKDSEKAFFGYRFYTVLTNSMLPRDPETQKGGFAAGDIIIVEMIKAEQLKVGDIITFNLMTSDPENTTVLTHRLIEIMAEKNEDDELLLLTQGDANTGADRPITGEQVVGKKVFTIPKVGKSIKFLRKNMLVSVGVLVSVFALIISLRYYFSYSPEVDPLRHSSTASYRR